MAWLSRQKDYVDYSIPLTEDNLSSVELMKLVRFKDAIYTDDEYYTGWVTSLEYDTKNDKINLRVMLAPLQMQTVGGDGLIIERGILLNDITVTETGTNTDTVTETGVI